MLRELSAPGKTRAARVWRHRLRSELEAARRFDVLATELAEAGASAPVVAMAAHAAVDERRHAELCAQLVLHFGEEVGAQTSAELERVAPRELEPPSRLLYELVATSCVTETLSTALLGRLVELAADPFVRRTMHSILRDEVLHARLGWAFLAEQRSGSAAACVGRYLPAMFEATVGPDLFRGAVEDDPLLAELAGLGCLDDASSRRIVCETLELVVLPGLARFGVDVSDGARWLAARRQLAFVSSPAAPGEPRG